MIPGGVGFVPTTLDTSFIVYIVIGMSRLLLTLRDTFVIGDHFVCLEILFASSTILVVWFLALTNVMAFFFTIPKTNLWQYATSQPYNYGRHQLPYAQST